MKNRKKYKFIIDFDGTISVNDSTTTIARHFVPEMQKKYEERLHKKEISIAKYVQELLEASNLTEKTYIRFLEQNIVIDPTFKDFIKEGYDYTIVSAGAFQNIFYSLKAASIDIPPSRILSNQIQFLSGCLKLHSSEYPHKNGIDKKKIIQNYQSYNITVIFIGDGIYDFEGAEAADVVLAKRDKRLEKYCVKHQISCFTYENFRDICHILENEKLI